MKRLLTILTIATLLAVVLLPTPLNSAVFERLLIKMYNRGCSIHVGVFEADEYHGQVFSASETLQAGVTPLTPNSDYERLVCSAVLAFLRGQTTSGPPPWFENHYITTGKPKVPEGS